MYLFLLAVPGKRQERKKMLRKSNPSLEFSTLNHANCLQDENEKLTYSMWGNRGDKHDAACENTENSLLFWYQYFATHCCSPVLLPLWWGDKRALQLPLACWKCYVSIEALSLTDLSWLDSHYKVNIQQQMSISVEGFRDSPSNYCGKRQGNTLNRFFSSLSQDSHIHKQMHSHSHSHPQSFQFTMSCLWSDIHLMLNHN